MESLVSESNLGRQPDAACLAYHAVRPRKGTCAADALLCAPPAWRRFWMPTMGMGAGSHIEQDQEEGGNNGNAGLDLLRIWGRRTFPSRCKTPHRALFRHGLARIERERTPASAEVARSPACTL